MLTEVVDTVSELKTRTRGPGAPGEGGEEEGLERAERRVVAKTQRTSDR